MPAVRRATTTQPSARPASDQRLHVAPRADRTTPLRLDAAVVEHARRRHIDHAQRRHHHLFAPRAVPCALFFDKLDWIMDVGSLGAGGDRVMCACMLCVHACCVHAYISRWILHIRGHIRGLIRASYGVLGMY